MRAMLLFAAVIYLASLLFVTVVVLSVGKQNQPQPGQSYWETASNPNGPPATPAGPQQGSPIKAETSNPKQAAAPQEAKPFLTHGEWIMGILTLVYVLISFFGLRAIEKQGDIAKGTAKAALLTAQAVINAERAWLDIDFVPVRPGESGVHHFRVSNHGKSPGFVTGRLLGRGYWDKTVTEIPLGSTGTVTPEKLPLYNIIPPNTLTPINILTFDVAQNSPGEEGQSVTYHGHLTYRDIFKQEHRTEIVYKFHSSGTFLEPLPKYSRYITKTEQGEEID
jgi:hypothetical protein